MHKVALGAVAVTLAAPIAHAQMTISSAEISDGSTIKNEQVLNEAAGFGCKGGNVSPSLTWSGAPSGTKSFAVTAYDPDAPTGSGFWHWVVVNIPASTTALPKGAGDPKGKGMPKGVVQARNDTGAYGYAGPCPPQGDKPHHYIFTVFAVDADKLPFAKDKTVTPAVAGFALHFHMLGEASFTGLYGR
jgi:Raf kinase inhibitor-like YbhB/YbcL family protein